MAASAYFGQVQKLYIAYFGRPADPVGLNYWAANIDALGGNFDAAIKGFAASTESQTLYAAGTTAQLVSSIYVALFNRPPEAAGLAYWTSLIDAGTISGAGAAYQILNSAGPGDAQAIQNKLVIANAFTASVDTPEEIAGYNGAASAASARGFLARVDSTSFALSQANATLTTGVADATGTGKNTATPPPLSSFINTTVAAGGTYNGTASVKDNYSSTIANLNGTTIAGNVSDIDTLTLTTAGTVSLNNGTTGGTLSNLKTLTLADGTNTITYNSSAGFTSIKGGSGNDSFIINSALFPITIDGGAGTDSLSLSAAYAATASQNNTFASNVTNIEKLGLTSVSNQSIDLQALGNYNDVTLGSGANSLTLLNLPNNGNLALTGPGTSLTLSNAVYAVGLNDTINLSLSDASTSSVAFASAGIAASGVERVNITNTDNQTVPNGQFNNTLTWLGNSLKTINVSGNAGLTLSAASTSLTTVDASGLTLGGFTWVAGGLVDRATIKGSATGTNVVNMIAATAGVDYTGGAGNDNIAINATVASTADLGNGNNSLSLSGATILGTYTGGTGSDSLALFSTTPNISGAALTGFEHLTVTNNAVITANADQLAQFTGIINASGTETINLMTAGSFSALNNIERYNLANGTNTFTATNSTRNVVGGTGDDTFNFTADQVASTLSVLNGGLGNDTLNIGSASTQTIDLSVKVTGVEVINVAGSTGTADFINADGAGIVLNYTKGIGNNNIALGSGGQTLNMLGTSSAATTIMGGAAVDHINLSSTGSGSETIIASGPNMSNNTQIDVVANFNATGNDYFKTGIQATSLGVYLTGNADTPTFLTTLASGLSLVLNNTGQAFQITINTGSAAGTYLFQNTGSNTSQFDSTDFFVQLSGSIGAYSELNLIA